MDVKNPGPNKEIIVRLDQLFDQQSLQYPDKEALKYRADSYTYTALYDTSTRIALYLLANGIKQNDVVGVVLNRSAELIVILLAIVKTGATYLPIDPSLPADRVNYMLTDSGSSYCITSKNISLTNQQNINPLFVEDIFKQYQQFNVEDSKFNAAPDGIAYILYTSGSTGKPKGVQIKHSGLLNLLLSMQQLPGANHEDVVLATTTISFDIAMLEIFLPLITGGTLVLADAETIKDGRLLVEAAIADNVTIMQGTPAMWQNMLQSGWIKPLKIKALCGGEALSKDLLKNLLPKCNELWNMYGPTETTIWSTIKQITANNKAITVGRPINGTQVYICDQQQNKLPDGEIGEIIIGGAGVATGYLNRPELNNEKFLKNKFSGTGEMYRTGDLGRYLQNGEIECMGRIDHQIKIRGFRVETGEIEYQLKQLAEIQDALVTLFKDALDHPHLGAYIVLKYPGKFQVIDKQNDWKADLKNYLPDYMVPDNYKIISAIPLLVNGKIDRNALPRFVLGEALTDNFEKANTKTEELLVDICLQFIAVPEIGVNDNLFELGLDSLTAVRIMVQIEQQFLKRLPLSKLTKYPTIKSLAKFIDMDTPDSRYQSLISIKPTGDKIPLYIIHGMGLNLLTVNKMVSHLSADQPVFGLQPLGLDGVSEPLDNMEEIAKFYIDEVIDHNPAGPYILAGYSFGGYIAFEMARQLKERGKEVAMLGMFDSNMQIPDRRYDESQRIKIKLLRQFKKVPFRIATILTHPAAAIEYLGHYFRNKKRQILGKFNKQYINNPDALPKYMLDIMDKLETAYRNYYPRPLDVQIQLFKAKIRMFYVDDSKYFGWKKYALKGVKIYEVPGDHELMFTPPNDKILADVLQSKLDEINTARDQK